MQQKAGEKAENKTVDTHEQNYLTENKLKTELSMNQEYTRTSAANAGKTQQDYRAGEQAVDTAPKWKTKKKQVKLIRQSKKVWWNTSGG